MKHLDNYINEMLLTTAAKKSKEPLGALHVGLHEYMWIIKDGEERLSENHLTNWKNLVTIFNKISENFS